MPQPTDALDLRRAHESVIMDALAVGHPLALAEAYHRTVPAAHAVARRLMTGSDGVEDLLLKVYSQLWAQPPTSGPLEGWIRRQTWSTGVEILREDGTAPASPSTAGLLPDLPAPDVRFLDAAERAISELTDDERRALLLAHDKGVPTSGQEAGAADSLTRALLALAGPETSTGDRAALHEDGCDDLDKIGDWCLGVASAREANEIDTAVEDRPGCAAKSRAARRGRRRIEGLPATPDMGQRILVTVLSNALSAAPASDVAPTPVHPSAPIEPSTPVQPSTPVGQPVADPAESRQQPGVDADTVAALDPTDEVAVAPVTAIGEAHATDQAEAADGDPFATMDSTGPLPMVGDHVPDESEAAADDPIGAEPALSSDTGPLSDVDAESDPAITADASEVGTSKLTSDEEVFHGDDDMADVVEDVDLFADDADAADADWRPDPGSTAELRLSDILAEGDDDPFADLEDAPAQTRPGGDPYAGLNDLGGDTDADPIAGTAATMATADDEPEYGYVEGQDRPRTSESTRSNALLMYILPIIGGSLLGVILGVLYFS